jgi:hypothetical protein
VGVLLLLTLMARPAAALGGPYRDVAKLAERTPIIVRGTVEHLRYVGDGLLLAERHPQAPGLGLIGRLVEPGQGQARTGSPDSLGEYEVRIWRAGVRVVSTVKGPAAEAGSTIELEFYRRPSGVDAPWGLLETGQHGLFFMDTDGRVADLFHPFVPLAPAAPTVDSGLPVLETIIRYLLLSLRLDAPELTVRSCVEPLIRLDVREAVDYLLPLLKSRDPLVVGDALWGLVALGDRRAVPLAVEYVLRARMGTEIQVVRIGGAIGYLTEPSLAPAIMPLLASGNPRDRGCALHALRRMKVPDTIPAFAYAALHDADQSNRYVAMMAVGEITGKRGPWITSLDEFDQNPSHYRGLFGEWWTREGAALYGSGATAE